MSNSFRTSNKYHKICDTFGKTAGGITGSIIAAAIAAPAIYYALGKDFPFAKGLSLSTTATIMGGSLGYQLGAELCEKSLETAGELLHKLSDHI